MNSVRLPAPLVCLALLLLSPLPRATGADLPDLSAEEEALVAGRFAEAASGFEALAARKAGTARGEVALFRASCAWLLAGNHDKAKKTLETFTRHYAGSPYRRKANHLLARAADEAGDPLLASRILLEELEGLTSEKTRQAVADLLIRRARRWIARAREAEEKLPPGKPHPAWPKARALLEKARELGGASPGLDRDLAEACRQTSNPGRAAELLVPLAEAEGPDRPADALRAARALMQAKNRVRARDLLSPFLDDWRDDRRAPEALDLLARSFRPDATDLPADAEAALQAWTVLLEIHARHALAPSAARSVLALLQRRGETDRCASFADRIASLFPGTPLEGEAKYVKARCRLEAGLFEKAVGDFEAFLRDHPGHPLAVKARRGVQEAHLEAAKEEERAGRLSRAVAAYRAFLASFPIAPEAGSAALALAACLARGGDEGAAVEAYRRASERYEKEAPRALLAAGEICERIAGRAGEAVEIYETLSKKHPETEQGGVASARLKTLREVSLRLEVKKTFPTGSRPTVELRTRNVESVTFRLNRLDLEEFFLAGGGLRGIDKMDLEVVKSDRVWKHAVEDYEAYEASASGIPVPVQGPGAWIVRAEAGNLQARVLLLVSDLSLVLKCARGRFLAFTRNETDRRPVQGARVLMAVDGAPADGGRTGKQGVLEGPLPGSGRGEVPVAALAVWKGHYAGAGLEKFLGIASKGFASKGIFYTARTLYRPGERVAFRGVLRRGTGTDFETPAGETILVRALDPQNRIAFESEVTAGPFGTVAGAFDLVPSAASGTWTIQARLGAAQLEGSFEVRFYRKPAFALDVIPERDSCAGGERVKVLLRAKSLSGLPLGGLKVRWSAHSGYRYANLAWMDHRQACRKPFVPKAMQTGEAVLDGQGEARIEVDTQRFRDPYRILIRAETRDATGATVAGDGIVFVAPEALVARITPRSLPLPAGDRAALLVETRTPSGKRVAAEGTLIVERKGPGGGFVETDRRRVRTSVAGRLEIDLGALESGVIRVRFVTRDRRGAYVVAERECAVAEETREGEAAVRVSADRSSYLAGERASLEVRGEGLKGAGLLTVEGEQVLDWTVVSFEAACVLPLAVKARFAPNAIVEVAVPGEGALLRGACALKVSRRIEVEVTTDRETYGPGETVWMKVTTRDARGRPVPAEVSVGVVEEAIYRLEEDRTPPLYGFFYDFSREHGVKTTSSCGFSWRAAGRAMDLDFLEEQRRRKRNEDRKVVVLEKAPLEDPLPEEGRYFENGVGVGGGSGGRFGGRRNLRAYGGGRRTENALLPLVTARRDFKPQAFWSASVTTDASGEAEVRFRLPDNLTTWVATAKAATKDARFGETRTTFKASRNVTVKCELPRMLREGDRFRAVVRALSKAPEEAVRVTLDAEGATGSGASAFVKTGEGRRGFVPASFTVERGARFVEVRATASGREGEDSVVRRIPVRPGGHVIARGFGRVVASRTLVKLALPTDRIRGGETLRIRVDPGIRFCIAEALRDLKAFPYGCIEQTVSRFVPAVSALEAFDRLGLSDPELSGRFKAMALRGLQRLYNHQAKDGSFGWWRRGADVRMTAYAFLAMAVSKERGVPVSRKPYIGAGRALARMIEKGHAPVDVTAFALYALSHDEPLKESRYLSVFLRRSELGPAGRALLALALFRSGRPGLGGELARGLASLERWKPKGAFTNSEEECAGYVLAAMVRAGVEGVAVEKAVRFLLEARRARGWSSTRATGAAVTGLSAYLGRSGEARARGSVRVLLNGEEIGRFGDGPAAFEGGSSWIEVSGPPLGDGVNRLELVPEGSGRFLVSGEFSYRSEERPALEGKRLEVSRDLRVLPPSAGREGASILAEAEESGDVPSARPGDLIRVRLVLKPFEPLSYVMVEDPLPGGVEVLGPATGFSADAFEDRGSHVALFFSRVPARGLEVVYFLRAVHAGRFTAGPTRVEPMYQPEGLALGEETFLLIDDAEGVPESADVRYARAEEAFHAGKHGKALSLYEGILGAFRLKENAYRGILERVLACSLALERDRSAVRAFGLLSERGAGVEDDVSRMLQVASAHARSGEGAVAVSLLRRASGAVVRDYASLQGLLGEAGGLETVFGVPSLSALLPDAPELAETAFTRAAAKVASREREDLLAGAGALLRYGVDHPGAPNKEKAWALGLKALLDAKAYAQCVEECERHARLFPEGRRLDEALFYRAFALFALGRHSEALEGAREILSKSYFRPRGGKGPSRFLHNAEYLIAQVLEVEGEGDEAVAYYRRASKYIREARRALAELTEAVLEAEGIVKIRPGETARIHVAYRNTPEVSVKAYPVDLGLYFTIYKGFRGADRMRLSGVPAATAFVWKPGTSEDRRRHESALGIEGLETGAYLVMLRAGLARASVLVVVSDLAVSSRTFGSRLRVEVRDGQGERVWGAGVQVAGAGKILGGGYTDPRGVFEAEDVDPDAVHILASVDGRYGLETRGKRR